MALEKVRDILRVADEHGTSVMAFDAFDYNTIYAVIHGAQRAKKPVIAMLYPAMHTMISLRVFAETVRDLAAGVDVPVGLHLDHSSDFDFILAAIRAGFTSVMADGSALPFEENVRFTASVTRVAKAFGVDVEGELGKVGSGMQESDYGESDLYTTAEEAQSFAERTGVASLAVAIGSAHGIYKKAPKLDIARLKEIDAATGTPLVLHGGSGIPDDQLRDAFASGINKFNVGTEFFLLNAKLTKEAVEQPADNPFGYVAHIREGLTAYIADKVKLTRMTC